MWFGLAMVVTILACAVYAYRRRLPSGVWLDDRFRTHGSDEFDRAVRAAERFELELGKREPCIAFLEANKMMFEKACRELAFRLPQDSGLRAALDERISASSEALEDHAEAARRRCPRQRLSFPFGVPVEKSPAA